MKFKLTISMILIATVLLTACGGTANPPQEEATPDVAVIRTSAASTVVSQFTLTAAAFTPTPAAPTTTAPSGTSATPATPQATDTAATQPVVQVTNALGTTVAYCDLMEFVADVNVPDNTNMSPG